MASFSAQPAAWHFCLWATKATLSLSTGHRTMLSPPAARHWSKHCLKTPAGPVAFTHVRAFVDGNHFAEDQTVVVDKSVIAQVGPAASTRAKRCPGL